MQTHTLGEVDILGTVLLRVYSGLTFQFLLKSVYIWQTFFSETRCKLWWDWTFKIWQYWNGQLSRSAIGGPVGHGPVKTWLGGHSENWNYLFCNFSLSHLFGHRNFWNGARISIFRIQLEQESAGFTSSCPAGTGAGVRFWRKLHHLHNYKSSTI